MTSQSRLSHLKNSSTKLGWLKGTSGLKPSRKSCPERRGSPRTPGRARTHAPRPSEAVTHASLSTSPHARPRQRGQDRDPGAQGAGKGGMSGARARRRRSVGGLPPWDAEEPPARSRSEAGGAAAQPELQIPGAAERERRKGRPGAGLGGEGRGVPRRGGGSSGRATFWLRAVRAEDHVRGQQLQPDPKPGHPRRSPGSPQRRCAAPRRGLQHHPRRHALQHHPGR